MKAFIALEILPQFTAKISVFFRSCLLYYLVNFFLIISIIGEEDTLITQPDAERNTACSKSSILLLLLRTNFNSIGSRLNNRCQILYFRRFFFIASYSNIKTRSAFIDDKTVLYRLLTRNIFSGSNIIQFNCIITISHIKLILFEYFLIFIYIVSYHFQFLLSFRSFTNSISDHNAVIYYSLFQRSFCRDKLIFRGKNIYFYYNTNRCLCQGIKRNADKFCANSQFRQNRSSAGIELFN